MRGNTKLWFVTVIIDFIEPQFGKTGPQIFTEFLSAYDQYFFLKK